MRNLGRLWKLEESLKVVKLVRVQEGADTEIGVYVKREHSDVIEEFCIVMCGTFTFRVFLISSTYLYM